MAQSLCSPFACALPTPPCCRVADAPPHGPSMPQQEFIAPRTPALRGPFSRAAGPPPPSAVATMRSRGSPASATRRSPRGGAPSASMGARAPTGARPAAPSAPGATTARSGASGSSGRPPFSRVSALGHIGRGPPASAERAATGAAPRGRTPPWTGRALRWASMYHFSTFFRGYFAYRSWHTQNSNCHSSSRC